MTSYSADINIATLLYQSIYLLYLDKPRSKVSSQTGNLSLNRSQHTNIMTAQK